MCLCVLYTMCFVSNAIIRLVYDVLSSTSIYIRYMIVYTFIFNNDDAELHDDYLWCCCCCPGCPKSK